jgi:hypothetical protein
MEESMLDDCSGDIIALGQEAVDEYINNNEAQPPTSTVADDLESGLSATIEQAPPEEPADKASSDGLVTETSEKPADKASSDSRSNHKDQIQLANQRDQFKSRVKNGEHPLIVARDLRLSDKQLNKCWQELAESGIGYSKNPNLTSYLTAINDAKKKLHLEKDSVVEITMTEDSFTIKVLAI